MKELDEKKAPAVGGGSVTEPVFPEPIIMPTYPLPPNPYPTPDPGLDPTGSHPML